jgi:hypothetical protein
MCAELNAKKCGEKTVEIYLELLNCRKLKTKKSTELNAEKRGETTSEIDSLTFELNAKNNPEKFSADS